MQDIYDNNIAGDYGCGIYHPSGAHKMDSAHFIRGYSCYINQWYKNGDDTMEIALSNSAI